MFPLYIAKHYFFSKYTKSSVNIIALVSMLAIAVVTAAMVIIFSVLNGFDGLVKSMYDSFYPSVKISPASGKFFQVEDDQLNRILAINEVESLSKTLQERAIFMHGQKQYVGILKGVDEAYEMVSGVDEKIYKGVYAVKDDIQSYAVVGAGVAARLGLDVEDPLARIKIYLPKRGFSSSAMFNQSFKSELIYAAGAFSIQQEIDIEYMLTNIGLVQKLMSFKSPMYSSIELKLSSEEDLRGNIEEIQTILGDAFLVEDRYEQNKSLYQIMQIESWIVYIILSMILLISAFNIGGFLIMLILEKKKDIYILKSMGATAKMIKNIVMAEGILISGIGSVTGILFAILILLAQQYFGLVGLPGSTFIVEAYPVIIKGTDLLLVFTTVTIVSFITVWYPARLAAKRF